MASGAYRDTHTRHKHTDCRTKEISRNQACTWFKNVQLCNQLTVIFLKKIDLKCIGYCYNKVIPVLNKAKSQSTYIQPVLKAHMFTCISSAGKPASLPACHKTRCRALKFTLNNGFLHLIYKTAIYRIPAKLYKGKDLQNS